MWQHVQLSLQSTKTECGYLYGWIKNRPHTQKSHQKVVNTRNLAGNAEEEKEEEEEEEEVPTDLSLDYSLLGRQATKKRNKQKHFPQACPAQVHSGVPYLPPAPCCPRCVHLQDQCTKHAMHTATADSHATCCVFYKGCLRGWCEHWTFFLRACYITWK